MAIRGCIADGCGGAVVDFGGWFVGVGGVAVGASLALAATVMLAWTVGVWYPVGRLPHFSHGVWLSRPRQFAHLVRCISLQVQRPAKGCHGLSGMIK